MLRTVARRSATSIARQKQYIHPAASSLLNQCPSNTFRTFTSRPTIAHNITKTLIFAPQSRTFQSSARMSADTRTESDAFGEIQVPSDKYWGAQTERSLENFKINQPQDRMPPPIVRAFGVLKGAAATVNMNFGLGMVVLLT